MKLVHVLTIFLSMLFSSHAHSSCVGQPTFRKPANSDIQVFCGSRSLQLHILLCPVYFSGYNESLLALNSQHSNDRCKGTADWTLDPPVVKFNFSLSEEAIASCSSTLTLTQEAGTGVFAEYSNVQHINVAGMVCSTDPGSAAITYHQEVMYRFSCRYPLQYLVNNTQMSVAGASLAVRDNNGSFISTLSMRLFSDHAYSSTLLIPTGGLELKTRIFVEVKASNLSSRFNVLLDRCYATTSMLAVSSSHYDLFVGCTRDGQTVIQANGQQQEARFSFEAFRFLQSVDATLSTYYIHCATRLCDHALCSTLTQNCSSNMNVRGRSLRVSDNQDTTVSDATTVSSGPISIRADRGHQETLAGGGVQVQGPMLAVSITAAVAGTVCFGLMVFILHHKHTSIGSAHKPAFFSQQ